MTLIVTPILLSLTKLSWQRISLFMEWAEILSEGMNNNSAHVICHERIVEVKAFILHVVQARARPLGGTC